MIGMKNLQDGKVDFRGLTFVSLDDEEKAKLLLKDGDILLNRTNSYDLVGKVGFVEKAIEAVFASYLVRLEVDKTKADSKFIAMWLSGFWADQMIKKIATRAISQANVNPTEFKKFCLAPVIPLPEQKAIADLLSTWDEAIEKTERLIQAKERRFKWLLRELISELRNTQKDAKWKKVKIGSFLTESRIPGTNGRDAQKITVKLYGKGVIAKDEKRIGSETTQYYVRKSGQFIYSKLDFLNGAFGIIPEELDGFESTLDLPAFNIADSVSKKWFLYYLIRPEYYTRQLGLAKGQRKARRVNPSEFLKSKIPFPQLEVQKQIAETLSSAQLEIALLQQLAEKYKTQKRGLMQRLLTGD